MNKQNRNNSIYRTSSLISARTRKMAFPYIGSTLCVAAVTAIDSLVAGVSIGSQALAALTAVSPFLSIEQILHCLLGYGIDKLMIRAIGNGKRQEANRIFGTVLTAVFFIYLLVIIPLLVFERPIMSFFIEDAGVVDLAIKYSVPVLGLSPMFEVLLCIERAFRVDGRAGLMSLRATITNIVNIVFDFLLVSVLGYGISGLAWASVISAAVGYVVPMTHFFSKKRTVSPDFSVIFKLKEFFSYVKQDVKLGSAATLDEVLEWMVVSVQTAAISTIGGAAGLAVWAVFKTVKGIVLSLSNGISASVSVHAGMLFGEKDYDGARFSARAGTHLALTIAVLTAAASFAFAGPIAALYRVEEASRALCVMCLRIGCFSFPPIAFMTIFGSYLPSVNKIGRASAFVVDQKILPVLACAVGFVFDLRGVVVGYSVSLCIGSLAFLYILLKRDGRWFLPEKRPEDICAFSIELSPALISEVSIETEKVLRSCDYPADICIKASHLSEEALSYIMRQNTDRTIRSDIKINRHAEGLSITFNDNGVPYNPLCDIDSDAAEQEDEIEKQIICGFASSVEYNRALDLNQLSLLIKTAGDRA